MARDTRSERAQEYRHLYNTTRWRKLRGWHLAANPLCVMCLPRTQAATVVDHVREHKGEVELFFDPLNLQSLCTVHHSSTKQALERGSFRNPVGVDGWPLPDTAKK